VFEREDMKKSYLILILWDTKPELFFLCSIPLSIILHRGKEVQGRVMLVFNIGY
jgi:hypothetical protein